MEEFQHVYVVRFILEVHLQELVNASFHKWGIVQGNARIRHQVRCKIPTRFPPPCVCLLHGILGHQQGRVQLRDKTQGNCIIELFPQTVSSYLKLIHSLLESLFIYGWCFNEDIKLYRLSHEASGKVHADWTFFARNQANEQPSWSLTDFPKDTCMGRNGRMTTCCKLDIAGKHRSGCFKRLSQGSLEGINNIATIKPA